MIDSLPGPISYLVIAAHPDDADICCGGSMARWASEGNKVVLVIITSGQKGTKDPSMSLASMALTRHEEQREASRILGITGVKFLEYIDGEVENTKALRQELAMAIRIFKPRFLVTHDPWKPYELHPDHRAAGMAAVESVIIARDPLFTPIFMDAGLLPHSPEQILLFRPGVSDLEIDISKTIDVKLKAIMAHRSQFSEKPQFGSYIRQRSKKEDGTYFENFKIMKL